MPTWEPRSIPSRTEPLRDDSWNLPGSASRRALARFVTGRRRLLMVMSAAQEEVSNGRRPVVLRRVLRSRAPFHLERPHLRGLASGGWCARGQDQAFCERGPPGQRGQGDRQRIQGDQGAQGNAVDQGRLSNGRCSLAQGTATGRKDPPANARHDFSRFRQVPTARMDQVLLYAEKVLYRDRRGELGTALVARRQLAQAPGPVGEMQDVNASISA